MELRKKHKHQIPGPFQQSSESTSTLQTNSTVAEGLKAQAVPLLHAVTLVTW